VEANLGVPAAPLGGDGCHDLLYVVASKDYRFNEAVPPVKGFFYVYILVSDADPTAHYTGMTQNLEERLREHNRGACPHSSKYRPWRLEVAIAFRTETKAQTFERYLKSGSGREFARRHF
jgi:predicted GIY-YIG superfamily endonuclease